MCGIAGYFGARALSPTATQEMLSALRPRGPDAEHTALWTHDWKPTSGCAPNGLLHTRLSIVDPRPEADQPMSNAAGDIWISYNGEVYDWAADAAILTASGVQFRTRSDTEFLLHAYEHWGISFVERLRGMFAIGICDLRRRAVYVVRDRMGLKPVVYARRNDGFAFASTTRALLPWLPRDARGFSERSIDAYLAHRTIPAPRTIFSNIARLPPAHFLFYDLSSGALATREYWRPSSSAAPWLTTLDDAIRMRTVADRPLGLFLSSGVDSTAVACRLSAMGFHGFRTFTAAFPGTDYDEGVEALATSRQLGLANHAYVPPATISDVFARVVADMDEPFADPSSFPMWYLARETSKHVKVVLGGDGGDELLGGYPRYGKHLRTRWRKHLVLPSFTSRSLNGSAAWQRLLQELRLDWCSAYALRFPGFTLGERALLQPDLSGEPHYWRMPPNMTDATLATLLEIDRLNYLPDYILRKGDLCTMAHGLELRAPFLDHHVVASIMGVANHERFTRPSKKLLEPAVASTKGPDFFERKKRGFNPPIAEWIQKDLAPRLVGLGQRLSALTGGQVSMAAVDALVAPAATSRKHRDQHLLQLLMLDESLAQLTNRATHI